MKIPVTLPPGWIGGFKDTHAAFKYPTPDLSDIAMTQNMEYIDRLTRMQKVCWPEFSWVTDADRPDPRCFQMFAPDISRIGYDDTGQSWSIICPQQGTYSPTFGALNVEVTVTGQRGWVDEPSRTLAADMTVMAQIWFSPSAYENWAVKLLWELFSRNGLPFPSSKEKSIKIHLLNAENPMKEALPVRDGVSDRFESPAFADHSADAFSVANVEVKIGPLYKTGTALVDDFNTLVMEVFNLGSGNLLKRDSILTWNVWVHAPELVCRNEWQNHANRWRKSIDTGHGSPDGPGTKPRFKDGTPFAPLAEAERTEAMKLIDFLLRHVGHFSAQDRAAIEAVVRKLWQKV